MNMRYWCFIYVILLMELQVFSQERLEGFLGENITLPCTYNQKKLTDVTYFWRDKNGKTVYTIDAGKPSLNRQNPQFINRVWPFPEEWENGNFSLLLTNLKVTDSGSYSCVIPTATIRHTVELSVQVRPTSKTNVESKSSCVNFGGNKVSLFLFLLFITAFL